MIQSAVQGFKPFIAEMWKVENAFARKREAAKAFTPPIRIGGIDPGTLTGAAQIWVSQKTGKVLAHIETILAYDEIQQVHDLVSWLLEMDGLAQNDPPAELSIEDFKVNQVNGDEEFLSPVRVGRRLEGALLYQDGLLADRIRWQMPARKAEFTDDRLRALGMYTPGPDHRRDATRHALIGRKYALEKRGL